MANCSSGGCSNHDEYLIGSVTDDRPAVITRLLLVPPQPSAAAAVRDGRHSGRWLAVYPTDRGKVNGSRLSDGYCSASYCTCCEYPAAEITADVAAANISASYSGSCSCGEADCWQGRATDRLTCCDAQQRHPTSRRQPDGISRVDLKIAFFFLAIMVAVAALAAVLSITDSSCLTWIPDLLVLIVQPSPLLLGGGLLAGCPTMTAVDRLNSGGMARSDRSLSCDSCVSCSLCPLSTAIPGLMSSLIDEPNLVDASSTAAGHKPSSDRVSEQQPDVGEAVAKTTDAQEHHRPTAEEQSGKEKKEEQWQSRTQQQQQQQHEPPQVDPEHGTHSTPAMLGSTADASAPADVVRPAAAEHRAAGRSVQSEHEQELTAAAVSASEAAAADSGSAAEVSPGGLDKTPPAQLPLPAGPDVVDAVPSAADDRQRLRPSKSAIDGLSDEPAVEPAATAADGREAMQPPQRDAAAGQGEAAAAAIVLASNGAVREDNVTAAAAAAAAAATTVNTLPNAAAGAAASNQAPSAGASAASASVPSSDAVTQQSNEGADSIKESQALPANGQQQQHLEPHPHPGKVPVLSVPDEGEQLPSFDEWKEKMLAQQKQQADKFYEPSERPRKEAITGKTHKMSNYASEDCGAKVVAKNPEAGNANSVLNENMDDYLINPCSAKKWLVIELCDPVEIRQIDLGNLELFSSLPKNFSVFISPNSERYPTTKENWRLLGVLLAGEERAIHSFFMPREPGLIYTKYVKIEFSSHYGNEHYCPLTVLRVYGSTVVDDYDDDDDDTPVAVLSSLSAAGSASRAAAAGSSTAYATDAADVSGTDVLLDDAIGSRGGGGSHMLHITDTVVGIVKKVLGKSESPSVAAGVQGLQFVKNEAVAAHTRSYPPAYSPDGSQVTRHSGRGRLWGCLVCSAVGDHETCSRSTSCDHGLRMAGWTERCTEWAHTVCCQTIGLDGGCPPAIADDVPSLPQGVRSDDNASRAPVSCHHCTDSSVAGLRPAVDGRPARGSGNANEGVSRDLIDEADVEYRRHGSAGATTDTEAKRAADAGIDASGSSCGGCVDSSTGFGSERQMDAASDVHSSVAPELHSSATSHVQTTDHSAGSSGSIRTDEVSSVSPVWSAGSESVVGDTAPRPAGAVDPDKEVIYSSLGVVRNRPAAGVSSNADAPVQIIPESTSVPVASVSANRRDGSSDSSAPSMSALPEGKAPVISAPSQPDAEVVAQTVAAFEAYARSADSDQKQQQQQHNHLKHEVSFDAVAVADAAGGFVGEDSGRPCTPESGATLGSPSARRPSLSGVSDHGIAAAELMVDAVAEEPYLGSSATDAMDVRGKEGLNLSTVAAGGQHPTVTVPATAAVVVDEPAVERSTDHAQANAAAAASAEHSGGGSTVQLGAMPAQLPKREAAIMRLSNVIKTLEQNLTLTNRYLEEMSRKYRKQKEELQKALNATIDLLNKLSARVQVQEATHRLEMNTLRSELNELSNLARNNSFYIETLRDHGAVEVTSVLFALLLVTLVLTCCRRRSTLTKGEMAEMMKFMADAPPKVVALKRSSSSAGVLIHEPSEAADCERPLIRYRSQQVLSARQRSHDSVDEGNEDAAVAAGRTNVDIIYPLTWRTFNTPCPKKVMSKNVGGVDPAASSPPDPKLRLFRMRSPPTAHCAPATKGVRSNRRGCGGYRRCLLVRHVGRRPGARSARSGAWHEWRRGDRLVGSPPVFGDSCRAGEPGSSDDCECEPQECSEAEDAFAAADELGSFIEDVRTPAAGRHMPNGSACNGVPSDNEDDEIRHDCDSGCSEVQLLDERLGVKSRQPTTAAAAAAAGTAGESAVRGSSKLLPDCPLKVKAKNGLPPVASPAIGSLSAPDGVTPSQGRR